MDEEREGRAKDVWARTLFLQFPNFFYIPKSLKLLWATGTAVKGIFLNAV